MIGVKRFRITKYDPECKSPPYRTVPVEDTKAFTCERREDDHGGNEFAEAIHLACADQGHVMRFYSTSSDPDFDYDVVVIGKFEEQAFGSL